MPSPTTPVPPVSGGRGARRNCWQKNKASSQALISSPRTFRLHNDSDHHHALCSWCASRRQDHAISPFWHIRIVENTPFCFFQSMRRPAQMAERRTLVVRFYIVNIYK